MISQRVKRLPKVTSSASVRNAASARKPRRATPTPAGFPGTDGRSADDKDGNAEAASHLAGKNRRARSAGS